MAASSKLVSVSFVSRHHVSALSPLQWLTQYWCERSVFGIVSSGRKSDHIHLNAFSFLFIYLFVSFPWRFLLSCEAFAAAQPLSVWPFRCLAPAWVGGHKWCTTRGCISRLMIDARSGCWSAALVVKQLRDFLHFIAILHIHEKRMQQRLFPPFIQKVKGTEMIPRWIPSQPDRWFNIAVKQL